MSDQNNLLKLDVNIVTNTSQNTKSGITTYGISGAYTGRFTSSPGITCSSGGQGGVGQGQRQLNS
ncbi:hypothetical protein ACQUFE_15700 [Enterococcus casseliflavus]|uniref:hypothetical protein n=1 Tax=Enterococcus casseliflavus TaxID=37734 RepID=UPI00288D984E|nr:hypothetical protein [Enterococcus casseliflavus]MDT2974920.1 hypothetical protein [Enterococcus casseliflavus]